jgi:hypothetical protein
MQKGALFFESAFLRGLQSYLYDLVLYSLVKVKVVPVAVSSSVKCSH